MILKCVIVDDSLVQRLAIVKLIEQHPNLELLAQYNSAMETKKGLKTTSVDLIFLDIEMPEISGFDLIDNLDNPPQIIFITGKTEYAFKAFNYNATDFLQKPITQERFELAVDKAIENNRIIQIKNDESEVIYVKSSLKRIRVFVDDLLWIEAMGDYIKLITTSKSIVVLTTMKTFMNDLPQGKFLRIHKSYIVNLEKIDNYNSKFVVIGKATIPLSRNCKPELASALFKL